MSLYCWGEAVLKIAAKCDSFNRSSESSKGKCVGLYCQDVRVGLIKPAVLTHLLLYPDVFKAEEINGTVVSVKLSTSLTSVKERTEAVNGVLKDLKLNGVFPCLKGWRDENYAVTAQFGSTELFHCERAGARLLGILQYGVHLNGYVKSDEGEYKLWIAQRSETKATYPGMLDNMVAGAIAAGTGVFETLLKECEEEASLGVELASRAIPIGTISYFHEAPDGLEPETEFIYELELPTDYVPVPQDGEVSSFRLWTIEQVKAEISKDKFKPNCVLVILQFLLKHGLISPSEEPEYERLASCGHVNFHELHHKK